MDNGRGCNAGPLDLSAGLCSETVLAVNCPGIYIWLFASRAGCIYTRVPPESDLVGETIRLLSCCPVLACCHGIAFSGSDYLPIKPSEKYHITTNIPSYISSQSHPQTQKQERPRKDMTQPGPCSGSVQRKPFVSLCVGVMWMVG